MCFHIESLQKLIHCIFNLFNHNKPVKDFTTDRMQRNWQLLMHFMGHPSIFMHLTQICRKIA